MTNYVIAGFPNCGTHSLAAYLRAQGHDVLHYETAYEKNELRFKSIVGDRKIIFIIKDSPNRYKVDYHKWLKENLNDGTPYELVKLEDMIKEDEFPWLNKTSSR